jgi:hypothetical protein
MNHLQPCDDLNKPQETAGKEMEIHEVETRKLRDIETKNFEIKFDLILLERQIYPLDILADEINPMRRK